VAKEDALAPTALPKKDKGLAPGDVEVDTSEDLLRADLLAKITHLNEIVGGIRHQ
jgi:hypothetical protein